jgi:putative ABC transport system substrate-binding protein
LAACRPRAAAKNAVIGILYQGAQGSLLPPQITAFRDGLRDAGYIEGQNIELQYRAADRQDQLPILAGEVVRLHVQVIVAGGSEAVRAAQDPTKRIPIVMTSALARLAGTR